jgi:sortase A
VTRGPGATWSVGADAPTDIAARRRQLRDTQDEAERRRLEEELQELERGMLDGELGRLSQALEISEQRRRTAERTLAAVATDAAGKLLAVQAQRDEAIAERDDLRRALEARPRAAAPAEGERRVLPRGRAWRVLLVVALILGMLVVIDGVLTIVWQEPISAIFAAQAQHKLSKQLTALDLNPDFAKLRSSSYDKFVSAERLHAERASAAAKLLNHTHPGHALARLKIPSIGVNFAVIEGTSTSDLQQGPGHYLGTMLPGLPGTFAIAGHRTTFKAPFRNLNKLKHGSRIVVSMPYGKFVYRVVNIRSVLPSDAGVIVRRKGHQRLVLTACDPPFSAARRLIVSAIPV